MASTGAFAVTAASISWHREQSSAKPEQTVSSQRIADGLGGRKRDCSCRQATSMMV